MNIGWDTAYCAYYLGENPQRFANTSRFSNKVLSYSNKTDVAIAKSDRGVEVCVLGLCVDAHGEIPRKDIPAYLAAVASDVNQLSDRVDRLAGSFVIFAATPTNLTILTDATASIPVFYNADAVSSHEKLLAEINGLPLSERSVRLKKSGGEMCALPYTLSLYEGVRVLLPNHYLVLSAQVASVGRCPLKITPVPTDQSAMKTLRLTTEIANEYSSYHPLVCSLTGGWDSRVTLAILRNSRAVSSLRCYTTNVDSYFGTPLTETSGDLMIPRKLTRMFGLEYRLLDNRNASKENRAAYAAMMGDLNRNRSDFGETFREAYGDSAMIAGNIGDQLGKSIVGNWLPESMATASFLTMKTHLYDPEVKDEISAWLEDARDVDPAVSRFDLFEWEIRCGRWLSQIKSGMATAGVFSPNLYNCRELMLLWCGTSRKDRSRKELHKLIMNRLDERYLQFPVNVGKKYMDLMLVHPLLFYIGTQASRRMRK